MQAVQPPLVGLGRASERPPRVAIVADFPGVAFRGVPQRELMVADDLQNGPDRLVLGELLCHHQLRSLAAPAQACELV